MLQGVKSLWKYQEKTQNKEVVEGTQKYGIRLTKKGALSIISKEELRKNLEDDGLVYINRIPKN